MSRGASFEEVAAVCNRFQAESRKVTIRTVQAELKGSPSFKTISDHIDRWRGQQREINAHNSVISENLRNAVMAEIGRNVNAVRAEMEERNKESQDKVVEVLALLADTEITIENLMHQLLSREEETVAIRTKLEKQLVVAEEKIKAAERKADELANERDFATQSLEVSRTEAAKAQFQVERADHACDEANSKVLELDNINDELRKSTADAEKRAAVAETRSEERQKQIEDFQVQVQESKQKISNLEQSLTELRQEKSDVEKKVAVLETKLAENDKV